jgi:alpha-galactosidase
MNMRIALILMSYLCAAQQQIPLAALANTRALIKFNAETKIFRLSTVRSSWAFRIHPETGQLQHLYWGSLISNDDDLTYLDAENEIVSFDAGVKNGILQEFPDDGSGDYRLPAFRLRYEDDGYSLANFVYSSHKIDQLGGKVYAEWQPHVRTGENDWALLVECTFIYLCCTF